MLTLDVLKVLAHTGQPLNLQITRNPDRPEHQIVSNGAGRSCETRVQQFGPSIIQDLETALRHYPTPVTINGKPLETSPFPDQAQVGVKHFTDHEENSYTWNPPVNRPYMKLWHNAYVAGVLCQLEMPRDTDLTTIYHAKDTGGNNFWSKTKAVHVSPIIVVKDEEVEDLTANDLDMPTVKNKYSFLINLKHRARTQVKHTLQREDLPPKHDEPLYRYLLGNTYGPGAPFNHGIPIIVHGTPITLPDNEYAEETEQPLAVTITQALYRANQEYIPVGPYPSTWESKDAMGPKPRAITNAAFNTSPSNVDNGWSIRPADSIAMHLTLEETSDLPETTVSLPAPFLLEGNEDNVRVTYAKDTVGPEELSDAMLMAYWEEGESRSWNELKAEYGKASTRMYDLAKAAMQDPDEVLREQLQRVANKFSTELPQPKNSITVVSQDGHTTVTYDPTPSPVQPEGELTS